MVEDDFESLRPPPYTLMVEDYNGDNMLDLAGIEAPTPSRPRPMSAPTLQTVLDTQPPPSSTQTRYVYYQIFGSAAALPSKCAFDPQDNTIGRVPARTFAPPRTAGIIKRYIAQLEGIDYSQFEAIYPSESDVPIPDDTRIAILGDGGPGTSKESPLAISLRDADTPNSGPSLATPLTWSPVLLPAPLLPSITPPSPAISLPAPNAQLNTHQRSMSVSSQYSYDSTTPSLVGAAQPLKPKWTIGENGFAEPIESLTEAGKVVSRHQPPGWLSGQLQAVGHGVFMGKLGRKHGNVTQRGTILRDGMRLWVDARSMRDLTIRTGDTFRTYRVIVPETREITYLWTGDITIDNVQA